MAERSCQDWPARLPGHLGDLRVVAVTVLFLAPHIAPAAAIGHGAVAFAVGLVLVVAGVALRVLIVWRIRFEEDALLTTLDGRYRAYASQHKRLVPLVW